MARSRPCPILPDPARSRPCLLVVVNFIKGERSSLGPTSLLMEQGAEETSLMEPEGRRRNPKIIFGNPILHYVPQSERVLSHVNYFFEISLGVRIWVQEV